MHVNYRVVFIVFMSIYSSNVISSELPSWLIGVWKSNEALTLKSMNSTPGVTEKAKEILSNNFFGELIHIYTAQSGISYLPEEKADTTENIEYKKISIGENNVTLTYYSRIFEEDMDTTLYREKECFYILVTKWEFREYFCPHVLE